jgi:hypothetical protein
MALFETTAYDGYGYEYEALTVPVTVVRFDVDKIDPGDGLPAGVAVQLAVEDEAVRLRYDGGDPSGSDGITLSAGGIYTITGETNIRNARLIRDSGAAGDATVRVTYLRG